MSVAVTAFAPFIRNGIFLFVRAAIKTINYYELQHQNENHIFVLLATIGTYTNVKSECTKKNPNTPKTTTMYVYYQRSMSGDSFCLHLCCVSVPNSKHMRK